MKQKVYFRADASADIGYGHFVRTLALADMLKDDFSCTFFSCHPTPYQVGEMEKVCPYTALQEKNHYDDFLSRLQGDEIVVLDNYFFTTDYQRAVRQKGCRLACIDDMHDKHYAADVVINHVLTDSELFDVEPYTKLCLGHKWALLRKSFLNNEVRYHHKHKKSDLHVLIMFGGSDKYNLSEKTAGCIADLDIIKKITIVVGDTHNIFDGKSGKTEIKRNLDAANIAQLMYEADVAVLSASSVCLEAKACGLPIIAGYYVDNQKEVYEHYKLNKEIVPIGNLLDNSYLDNLRNTISKLQYFHKPIRLNIQDNYIRLFKWLSLKSFNTPSFHFKNYSELTDEESKQIWEMRNNDSIRCCMDNSNKFSYHSHLQFINGLSSDDTKLFWAVLKNNVIYGSINLSFVSCQEIERGVFISPQLIGKNVAKSIELELYDIFRNHSIKRIKVRVLKDNCRSLKYHLALGYKIISEDTSHYYLKLELWAKSTL